MERAGLKEAMQKYTNALVAYFFPQPFPTREHATSDFLGATEGAFDTGADLPRILRQRS